MGAPADLSRHGTAGPFGAFCRAIASFLAGGLRCGYRSGDALQVSRGARVAYVVAARAALPQVGRTWGGPGANVWPVAHRRDQVIGPLGCGETQCHRKWQNPCAEGRRLIARSAHDPAPVPDSRGSSWCGSSSGLAGRGVMLLMVFPASWCRWSESGQACPGWRTCTADEGRRVVRTRWRTVSFLPRLSPRRWPSGGTGASTGGDAAAVRPMLSCCA